MYSSLQSASAEPRYDEMVICLSASSPNSLKVEMSYGDKSAAGDFALPFSPDEAATALAGAQRVAQDLVVRKGLYEQRDPVRDIGGRLCKALFDGGRDELYHAAQQSALRLGRGLRLSLETADPFVASLPWEVLYDGHDFLALSARTPLVRRVPESVSWPSSPAERRLLVAVLQSAALPDLAGGAQPRLAERLAQNSPGITVVTENVANVEQLRDLLMRHRPAILHVYGHGIDSMPGRQALLAGGPDGRELMVPPPALASALYGIPSLRLVTLQVNSSDLFALELARAGVPAVIGIRGAMTDDLLNAFLDKFAAGMLGGDSLAVAVTSGRRQVDLLRRGSSEWGMPVLYSALPEAPMFVPASVTGSVLSSGVDSGVQAGPQGSSAADSPERQQYRSLIEVHQTNLEALKQRAAAYGGTMPPYLSKQIDDLTSKIDDLGKKLAGSP